MDNHLSFEVTLHTFCLRLDECRKNNLEAHFPLLQKLLTELRTSSPEHLCTKYACSDYNSYLPAKGCLLTSEWTLIMPPLANNLVP